MIRLIYDECNPTRDRRPATKSDMENDLHVVELNDLNELIQELGLATDVMEYSIDYDIDPDDTDVVVEAILDELDDPGDGSPNILYLSVDGKEYANFPYDEISELDLSKVDQSELIQTAINNFEFFDDDDEYYEDDIDESWYKGIEDDGDVDFVEDEIEEDYSDDYKNERYQRLVGKKIRILHMDDPYAGKDYDGREGVIEYVATDPFGDVYFDGTWGSLSVYPKVDSFEYVDEQVEEGLFDAEKEDTNYGHRAWVLNQIISSMNDETAYYDTEWLYLWPDGETEQECDDDFGDEESFKELEDTFLSIYQYNSAEEEGCDPEDAEYNFHRDGLYNPTKEAVQVAHEYDKKLGLEPIKVLGKVKECVDDVRFAESIEKDNLETFDDKMDFLAGDEEEAIDGYDEIIPEVEDEHIKDQLTHIRDEEKAHKKYLNDVKEDPSIDYKEPEELEEGKDKKQICCICGEEYIGYGNNAEPYKEGRCCDECNKKFVIPDRIKNLRKTS